MCGREVRLLLSLVPHCFHISIDAQTVHVRSMRPIEIYVSDVREVTQYRIRQYLSIYSVLIVVLYIPDIILNSSTNNLITI